MHGGEATRGAGVLAACSCATHALGEAACSLLFPSRFSEVRRWHGARTWTAAEALAEAEARLHEALLYSPSSLETAAIGNRLYPRLTVQSRVKSLRSSFEKLVLRGHDAVDDLLALRLIVEPADRLDEDECVDRCRDVEALVHALWPGRVELTKDYVASPKENGYRSVHLMLRLSSGERLEVQIRTRCMHEDAEHGGARHADYKASSLSAAPVSAIPA